MKLLNSNKDRIAADIVCAYLTRTIGAKDTEAYPVVQLAVNHLIELFTKK